MKNVKKYALPVLSAVLSVVISLFWVALRVNYSGISKFLGADTNPTFLVMNLPVIVCAVSWLGSLLAVLGLFAWEKRRWPAIAGLVIGIIMTVGAGVVIYFGARDYLSFIMVHFWKTLGAAAAIAVLALLLFFPAHRLPCWMKCAVLAAVILAAVVAGYGLRGCEFTYGAVVYAVEDTYQIVFSTSDSAMAWVTVGDENYYDLYAGSSRSVDRIHKVTVPQKALDAAGGYTVNAQQMIYRGPFGGYKGRVISQSYAFRPVDSSDGLDYVSLSDVHSAVDAAVKAAGREMDFLVLLGDLISMVETEADAQLANVLAHSITGGECPVIYARGNHEIKGEYSEVLYKYVGSLNQSYAYTVTLGDHDVFALVLDLGEDHADDWWEYYGTAQFDIYRQEQTELLFETLEAGKYASYRYQMVVCHIPIVYVDKNGYYEAFRLEWTELLNQMGVDIGLSGHKHQVWAMLPDSVSEPLSYSEAYAGRTGKKVGGYLTDFRFPNFLVGRRSLEQAGDTQSYGMTDYLCLHTHVDLQEQTQYSRFVNSRGRAIEVVYPFAGPLENERYVEIPSKLN